MKVKILLILFLIKIVCATVSPVLPYYPTSSPLEPGDYGDPLYLTPYIESGDVELARNLSAVGPLPNVPRNVESYAGYLTTRKEFNSNLFFWYFPAFENRETAETMIWMQGGPGLSTLYGVFMEHGPYNIYDSYNVSMRNYTWSKYFNVIYIDCPVGTGFSFTNNSRGYARTAEDVAEDVYTAVRQLFRLFPEFSTNDFYVAGESFAGKYVVRTSQLLQERKPPEIKFAGLLAGNPVISFNFIRTGELLYSIGLANEEQKEIFNKGGKEFRRLSAEGRQEEANLIRETLLYGGVFNDQLTYFQNITGFTTDTDFARSFDIANVYTYMKYISLPEFRQSVHTGTNPFNDGNVVPQYLELAPSVNEALAKLMNEYKVMLYYGQNDCLIPYLSSVDLLRFDLPTWKNYNSYDSAERHVWKVEPDDMQVAGYVTLVDKLRHVMVRNGGHMLPYYQPRAAQDMVRRFIKNIPFTD